MATLFTQIINGDIPSYKIYEDDLTYAFLDIFPIQKGQVVVVPKVEADHFYDLDDIYYQALMKTVKLLAPKIQKAFGAKRCGVMIEGLEVPHVHVKLVPISEGGDFDSKNITPASEDELKEVHACILEKVNCSRK